MPERFSPAQPNYLRFVSTPTIDIEPIFSTFPAVFSILFFDMPDLLGVLADGAVGGEVSSGGQIQ